MRTTAETASIAYAAGYRAAIRTSDQRERRIESGNGGYVFPAALYDELLAIARGEEVYEVCGILAGSQGFITRVFPIKNVADEIPSEQNPFISPTKSIHYVMDPVDQLRVYEQIEADGHHVAAYYHSHPGGDAMPSGIDTRLAADPNALWILISERADPPIRAWRIEKLHPDAVDARLIEVPLA